MGIYTYKFAMVESTGCMTRQKAFIQKIWNHYRTEKRDLPWRNTFDPYYILVSEMMLQQTQVKRVLVKYDEFLSHFPNIKKLAAAPMSQVLRVWKGLGYNRRAYFLKQISETIIKDYAGKFPRDYSTLLTLPGIGNSTAGAISAFAFQTKIPFIETNIRVVYLDSFFSNKEKVKDKEILDKISETLEYINPSEIKDFYYALYDYGFSLKQALGKKRTDMHKKSSHYTAQSKFIGSKRQLRSILLDYILNNQDSNTPKRALTSGKSILAHIKKLISNKKIPFTWDMEMENTITLILNDLVKKKQISLQASTDSPKNKMILDNLAYRIYSE